MSVTKTYAPAYVKLKYPGGDPPMETGVCSDVIIRALRSTDVDLQPLIYEDRRANFAAYRRHYTNRPDRNIDHRRVLNMEVYNGRQKLKLPASQNAADYRPGDFVAWNLRPGGSLPHIGIVSDRWNHAGTRPLILHNIGAGVQEEDILFAYPITGRYRFYSSTPEK